MYFPVGEDFEAAVEAWVTELRDDHVFGPDDPLFPATRLALDGNGHFAADGIERRPWTSAAPIREVFRQAFTRAGLLYFNPHSLRRTLMCVAYERDLTHKQLKAWNQNLGHESILTSLVSYGPLSLDEQAELIGELANQENEPDAEVMEIARQLVAIRRRRVASTPSLGFMVEGDQSVARVEKSAGRGQERVHPAAQIRSSPATRTVLHGLYVYTSQCRVDDERGRTPSERRRPPGQLPRALGRNGCRALIPPTGESPLPRIFRLPA